MDFAQAVRDYIAFGYCTSLNNLGTFGELMPDVAGGLSGAAGQAARFIHNQVCNNPEPPSAGTPPFTGGQCSQGEYDVFAHANYSGTAVPGGIDISGVAIGAIQGLTYQNVAGNSTLVFAIGEPSGSNTSGLYGVGSVPTDFGGGTMFSDAQIVSVSRRGGLPDNCGDPPPVVPPYPDGGNIVNSPISYTDNSGGNVTIDASVVFGYASVNVDGHLTIPFTFSPQFNNPVNVNGTFNLNTGDINFNAGNPRFPSPSGQPSVDDYGVDDETPPYQGDLPPEFNTDPGDPQQPQYARLLRGAIVHSYTIAPRLTKVFQPGGVDFYLPDLGAIYFQITVDGASGWTSPIKVQNERQFIPCPWEGGATAVTGLAREGGNFSIIPVYDEVLLNPTYPTGSSA